MKKTTTIKIIAKRYITKKCAKTVHKIVIHELFKEIITLKISTIITGILN